MRNCVSEDWEKCANNTEIPYCEKQTMTLWQHLIHISVYTRSVFSAIIIIFRAHIFGAHIEDWGAMERDLPSERWQPPAISTIAFNVKCEYVETMTALATDGTSHIRIEFNKRTNTQSVRIVSPSNAGFSALRAESWKEERMNLHNFIINVHMINVDWCDSNTHRRSYK